MSALAIQEIFDKHQADMYAYIAGYWYENDVWELENKAFGEALIDTAGLTGVLVDFRTFKSRNLKMEMKFYLLHAFKERELSVSNVKIHYRKIIRDIGMNYSENSFNGLAVKAAPLMKKERDRLYEVMQGNVIRFITGNL